MYEIYSIANCPFCEKAKELLRETGEGITEYAIDIQVSMGKQIMKRSLMNTVPIIYRNDQLIGGYNDLRMYLNKEERTHITESKLFDGQDNINISNRHNCFICCW